MEEIKGDQGAVGGGEAPFAVVFKGGVCSLGYEQLLESVEWSDAKGKLPDSRPVEHHELLLGVYERMKTFFNKGKLSFSPWKIIADEGGAIRVMWPKERGECPLDHYMFTRLVAMLDFKVGDDEDYGMCVAVSYNEKGISIAYGGKVWACNNQSIFGDNLVSTYGDSKMPYGQMMEMVKHWGATMEEKIEREMRYKYVLESVVLPAGVIMEIFGNLHVMAVGSVSQASVSMGITQVSEMIRNYLRAERKDQYSCWEVINWGTDVSRPEDCGDMSKALHKVRAFCDYVYDNYALPRYEKMVPSEYLGGTDPVEPVLPDQQVPGPEDRDMLWPPSLDQYPHQTLFDPMREEGDAGAEGEEKDPQ